MIWDCSRDPEDKIIDTRVKNKQLTIIRRTSCLALHATRSPPYYRSVMGYGSVELIKDSEEKKEGLDIILAHYGRTDTNLYPDKSLEEVIILKLSIEEMTGKQSGDWL